jgi:hypothetical protein
MAHVELLGFREKLKAGSPDCAIRAKVGPWATAPVPTAIWTVVPKLTFAVRGDEYWKATWEGRWIPRLPDATELDRLNRDALGQSVDSNPLSGNWAISANCHLISATALSIGHYAKCDFAPGVTDLFKILSHVVPLHDEQPCRLFFNVA